MTGRLTAILLSVAMLAVACSDDDAGDPSTTAPATTSPTTTEAPITTLEPTTSTTESPTSTAPPSTTTPPTSPTTIAVDDWPAILTELSRRRVTLYAAPDLSRIGEYCVPSTECAAQLEAQLGDAIARGQHIEGQQPFTVVAIEKVLEGEASPFAALTDVVFVVGPTASPPPRIVDSNGSVVEELTGSTTNTRVIFTVAKWDDSALPWRVVRTETLGAA